MSQFMPEGYAEQQSGQGTKAPEQGPEAYLSPDERKALQRSLSFPEDLPPKFRSWLIDFIAVNIPQIPVSQLVGFTQIDQVEVTTAIDTSQITSPTTGPTANVRAGLYVIDFGCLAGLSGGGTDNVYSYLSFNGVDDSSGTRIQSGFGPATSISRSVYKTLTETDNTVSMKYGQLGGATATWANRYIVAQRIGPVPS